MIENSRNGRLSKPNDASDACTGSASHLDMRAGGAVCNDCAYGYRGVLSGRINRESGLRKETASSELLTEEY